MKPWHLASCLVRCFFSYYSLILKVSYPATGCGAVIGHTVYGRLSMLLLQLCGQIANPADIYPLLTRPTQL